MWKYILGGFVSLVVAALVLFTLMNIRMQDVVAYNQLDRPMGAAPYRAGDMVEISADGQTPIGKLFCGVEAPEAAVSATKLEKQYTNGLRDFVPVFVDLVNWGKGLFIESADATPVAAQAPVLPFIGYKSDLIFEEPQFVSDCSCAIARVILRRNKVCTVQSSLIESKTVHSSPFDTTSPLHVVERTIGVTYRPFAQHIPDLSRIDCPGLNTEAILPPKPLSCPSGARWPMDVKLRGFIGVISERDYVAPQPVNFGVEVN